MKLQNKIIFMPLLIMGTVFAISLLGLEYNLKRTFEAQFDNELKSRASTALSAISLINEDVFPGQQIAILDSLADKLGKDSQSRISIIDKHGILLGDSALTLNEIMNVENHAERPEIQLAIENQFGKASRFSKTLSLDMHYFAVFDEKTGYIVRVAMSSKSHQSVLSDILQRFIIIVITTLIILFLVGLFASRAIRDAVNREKEKQQERIIAHTREITLMQTMTTMLNAVNNYDEASPILNNIMPKLLPSLSGAIYLASPSGEGYRELVHWGDNWQKEVTFISTNCWQQFNKRSGEGEHSSTCTSETCPFSSHGICINLHSEDANIGILQLINNVDEISDTEKTVAIQLADHITYALINIEVKSQLRHQAIRDPLTNLYNRRFMFESFEQLLHHSERHERSLAVLMIDLDYFKVFNDKFGHEAGDLVLISVAKLFEDNIRLEDHACRYGGEEFCIICPETGLREAYVLAEKLRNGVNELSLTCNDKELGKLSISIGISVFPNHATHSQDLIIQADKALYAAKRQGRNTTVVAQANSRYYQGNI